MQNPQKLAEELNLSLDDQNGFAIVYFLRNTCFFGMNDTSYNSLKIPVSGCELIKIPIFTGIAC